MATETRQAGEHRAADGERGAGGARGAGKHRAAERGGTAERAVTVLRTGPLAVVTDLGRPGNAHLGVPRSGALDAAALRLANRLVGNPEGHAGLELLFGGLELRAEVACTVAVTGTPVLAWRHDAEGRRHAVDTHRAVYLRAGERLELGVPDAGARCYLACSGGLDVPAELGSRSTDLLSGLGPGKLANGDRLPLGTPADPPVDAAPVPVSLPPPLLRVPVLLGPRDDWFSSPAEALRTRVWTVDSASNRIGLRLSGEPLARVPERDGVELPSEPMLPGAVQVPPSGQPVVFLADAPTTGGYPVVGVVPEGELDALAQARPGSKILFLPH